MEDVLIENVNSNVFEKERMNEYIRLMQECLEERFKNDFKFLCILQNIRMEISSDITPSRLANQYFRYIDSGCRKFIKFYDFFEEYFHLKEKTIKNYLLIAYKFLVQKSGPAGGQGLKFTYEYRFDFCKDLTISKMQELLPLSNEQIKSCFDKGILTVRSTKENIRKYVKSLKGEENKDNLVLEESNAEDMFVEPERYDPSKHYEKSWFNELSKGELVNYIFELQTYCEKLKEKKTKKV